MLPTGAKPSFNGAVDDVLGRCQNISNERGGEYNDTWSLENQKTTYLDATLRRLAIHSLTPEEKRLILVASLVDVKDSRMLGPWKEDTAYDAINYRAAYAAWRSDYEKKVQSTGENLQCEMDFTHSTSGGCVNTRNGARN